MADEKDIDDDIENILDDEKLRNYFLSRDPNRKKTNLADFDYEDEETINIPKSKKASEKKEERKDSGFTIFQNQQHIKNVARYFFCFGLSVGLLIAILVLIF